MSTQIKTMKEYCEKLRDNIITVEKLGYKTPSFDPRQNIKNALGQSQEAGMFYLQVAEISGEVTRTLKGANVNADFLRWKGGPDEAFGKEHFINTMTVVWPAF